MRKPNIPAQAVRNFCLSLGLFPNWKNMRLCWDLLCLAWMPLEDCAANIDNAKYEKQ